MDIEVTSDIENKLLGRREVECVFRGTSGALSRSNAAQAVSKQMKASDKKVYTVLLKGAYGTMDLKGVFYIYNDDEAAKKDLQTYVLKRNGVVTEAAAEAAPAEKPKAAAEAPKKEQK
ncbi:MAG: hypothetical protein A3K61_07245 [Thaumarchaeota archaeon RBG_16_49_8]|nr:MAG: hypothetical protein A3K61_07245 [Thaumarchaeota archaeon RBG_16_49_8]